MDTNSDIREKPAKGGNIIGRFLFVTAIIILSTLIYALISGFVLAVLPEKYSGSDCYSLITLPLQLVMTVSILGFARLFLEMKPRDFGFIFNKKALLDYLVGFVVGILTFSAATGLAVLLSSETVSRFSGFRTEIFLLYFVGWFFQGMAEEVMCRGLILTVIARGQKGKVKVAILANSLIFAAMHLGNAGISPLALINLTLFGIFASLIYLHTGNIWMCSAIHTAWNYIQGNFFGIAVSGGELKNTLFVSEPVDGRELINGGAFGLEGGLCVTVVMCIAIAITVLCRTKRKPVDGNEALGVKA